MHRFHIFINRLRKIQVHLLFFSVLLAVFALSWKSIAHSFFSKADPDSVKTARLTGTELTEAGIASPELAVSTGNTGESACIDFSSFELFAGQGGFDISATKFFPPEPAVWAKRLDEAGIYPDLSYSAYRIRQGDMISLIADRFGLSQDTLISVNNIKQTRLIQIGEYLRVPSMPGILYTTKRTGETARSIAVKYQVSAAKTASVNHLDADASLAAGVTVFVPDAFLDWITRQEINGDLFLRPLKMPYYLSSGYGWRKSPFTGERSFHNGIDMAARTWTPIYAALAGRVTTAGWSAIYGNYVIVTHHSGYRTLYGHLVDIKTWKGQSVTTNTVLGWVGNTGMSTGSHLHFSVFKYGSTVNPMSLWR